MIIYNYIIDNKNVTIITTIAQLKLLFVGWLGFMAYQLL